MNHLAQGLVAVLLGLFVGFSAAFVFSSDPTGPFPVVTGLVLTIVLTVIFYGGISKAASTGTE